MTPKIDSLQLSDKEMFFLALLAGADHMIGLADPFQGYLTEEIEEEWLHLKEEMRGKGYIYEDATGLYLDEAVDFFIQGCVSANTFGYFFCAHQGEEAYESFIYFGTETVMEKQSLPDAPGYSRLLLLESADAARQKAFDRFRFQKESGSAMHSLQMPNHLFQEWRRKAKDHTQGEIERAFSIYGGSNEAAAALAATLQHQQCEGQWMFMTWKNQQWLLNRVTFISGANGSWLIRLEEREDQDWVHLNACSQDELQRMLQSGFAERVEMGAAV